MRRLVIVFALAFSFVLGLFAKTDAVEAEAQKETRPDEFCDKLCQQMRLFYEKSESFVLVYAISPEGAGRGTAALISYEGKKYFLTNDHVAGNAVKVWVKFLECEKFQHEVKRLGRDSALDLALLTVPAVCRGVEPLKFADETYVGQQVYAVGYPFGHREVTSGRIAAMQSSSFSEIEFTAQLNPGNSGGPLLNERNELVGINAGMRLVFVPNPYTEAPDLIKSGISTAVHVKYVKLVLAALVKGEVIRHADANMVFLDAPMIIPVFFEQLGMPYPPEDGIYVTDVPKNSSAQQAGLQRGYRILKIDGEDVKSAQWLTEKIFFDYKPGDQVMFTVKVDGRVLDRQITLVEAKRK